MNVNKIGKKCEYHQNVERQSFTFLCHFILNINSFNHESTNMDELIFGTEFVTSKKHL